MEADVSLHFDVSLWFSIFPCGRKMWLAELPIPRKLAEKPIRRYNARWVVQVLSLIHIYYRNEEAKCDC